MQHENDYRTEDKAGKRRQSCKGQPTKDAARAACDLAHAVLDPFDPVLGASHAEFGPWGLRREFTLYDETAIWKQILLATGEAPDAT